MLTRGIPQRWVERTRAAWAAVLLTGVLGMTACSGPDIPVAGAWKGTIGDGIQLSLTLSETASRVRGSGVYSSFSGDFPVQVTGSYREPNVKLTLTYHSKPRLSLHAVVSETTLTGTTDGDGVPGVEFVMTRQ